jgi:Family of unknown function (DUF5406)
MDNYDPNLTYSGRMATQRVKLKFQQWGYSRTETVDVGGNCLGAAIFETAIGIVYDRLIKDLDKRDIAAIILKDGKQSLECEDDDNRGEDWLADMCVSAQIMSIKASPSAKGVEHG